MKKIAMCLVSGLMILSALAPAALAQDATELEAQFVYAGRNADDGELALSPYVSSVFCDDDVEVILYAHPNYLLEVLESLGAVEVGENVYALPDGRLVEPETSAWVIEDASIAPEGPQPWAEGVEPDPVVPPADPGDPLGDLPTVGVSSVLVEALPALCKVELKGWKCVDGDCQDNCQGIREWDNGPNSFCFCQYSGDMTDSCDAGSRVSCKWKDWSQTPCDGQIVNRGSWSGKKCTK